jgi:hypothetical protein
VQQTLLDQRRDPVQDKVGSRQSNVGGGSFGRTSDLRLSTANCLGRFQGEAAREEGQSPKQRPF